MDHPFEVGKLYRNRYGRLDIFAAACDDDYQVWFNQGDGIWSYMAGKEFRIPNSPLP